MQTNLNPSDTENQLLYLLRSVQGLWPAFFQAH